MAKRSKKSPSVIAIIPARYASTRLPAKILADIGGKPMIQHVYERSAKARCLDRVIVATDDQRIVDAVEAFGGEAMLTSPDLKSGTDRVAAIAKRVKGDIFVNVQGDEPLMDPKAIDTAVKLVTQKHFPMATVMTPLGTLEELQDPSVVKVLADATGRAIYFSRHPIPYSRGPRPSPGEAFACRRHVGLYVFTRATLQRFCKLQPSLLEKAEVLEQLRAMQAGIPIGIAEVNFTSIGVDTAEDLEKVRALLKNA